MTATLKSYDTEDATERQRLLQRHLGLVHHVARQIASRLHANTELEELVSAGTLGLIQAASAFEPSRGLLFSTFAVPRIRGAILDELRRQDRLPRSVRRKARAVSNAAAELQHECGRAPSQEELALRLGLTPAVLQQWQREIQGGVHVSLDTSRGEDGGSLTPAELLADEDSPSVDDRLTLAQETEHLRAAIVQLKEQERNVLALYYFEELKLSEIGNVLGLSACRISQIRTGALAKLRERLAGLRAA